MILDWQTVGSIIGGLTALGGVVHLWQKIAKSFKKSHDQRAAAILQEAKEADSVLRTNLENKIKALGVELKNLEQNVNKDIAFVKETQSTEIKNLGDRIEALRDELRGQHSQLVALLSKMIDSRD